MKESLTKERYNILKEKASKLLSLSSNHNPFYLSKILGIEVKTEFLEENVPGFILDDVIYISNKIDSYSKKIVCAHELGHYILHDNVDSFKLFYAGKESIIEFEANLFVKEIMPQVFARAKWNNFEYITDFNEYVESQIRFLE